MKRLLMAAVFVVVGLLAVPSSTTYGHGTVDQEFTGPFSFDLGINAAGGVSQGFVPTATNLVAADLFLTGSGTNPALTLTVNIRAGAYNGAVLGTSTVSVPAGITGTPAAPYIAHVDFGTAVTLTPGNLYYVQIDPDGGFLGEAASFGDPYPGGDGYQGDFTCCGLDLGFRTYFGDSSVGPPTSKDQCKNGGWALFDTPKKFKNQGDCVSFVATGGKNGPGGH